VGRGWILGGAAGLLLLLAPTSLARSVALTATGTLSGTGPYTLTVVNTSSDTVLDCIGFQPPPSLGVMITNVSGGPPGFTAQLAPNGAAFGGVHLNLAPGASTTFQITTAQPYPVNGGGTLIFAPPGCNPDMTALVSGPTPPPPPPPPAPPPPTKVPPCKCAKLTVKLDPTLLNKKGLRPDKHDFGVGFTWFLTCTVGGGTCSATIHFLPPEILAGTLPKPKQNLLLNIKRTTVTCGSPCSKSTTGRFQIQMLSRSQLNVLFGRTLAYRLVLRCRNTIKTIKVNVLVDQHGVLRPGK
jgi:hypothetical protein